MSIQEMVPGIYSVGSKDKHRLLFDQLMNLSEGTSYNAFLIKGSEKTALIDTVYPPCHAELVNKLKELGIEKLDYIVANHGEQDHTAHCRNCWRYFPKPKLSPIKNAWTSRPNFCRLTKAVIRLWRKAMCYHWATKHCNL